jgi:hypothetical protein
MTGFGKCRPWFYLPGSAILDPLLPFRKEKEFPGTAVPVLSCTARLRTGRMGDFFGELKRRHIYRVGAGYVVVAWALTQVVDLLSQIFSLPSFIAQPAILVLAAGFPIALIVAWVAERKPQELIAQTVRAKTAAVDWALFGAVAVLIVLSGYQQIARSPITPVPPDVQSAGSAISLAVLPFENLSGDAS